jgi:SAM-dependent methyltransferase
MYDQAFYDLIRPGVQASAAVVVPLVLDHIPARTVVDVGCGEGWWAHEFVQHGCEVAGIDGAYVTESPLGDRFIPHDLTEPLPNLGRYDLAVCFEVAEHLPPERGVSLIGELCALALTILFSAAIPGQGGVGHVNEQPPSYWAGLFNRHDYAVSGALRWLIWDDDRVEPWYRGNLLLAAHNPDAYPGLFTGPESRPLHVVHPVLFDSVRSRLDESPADG